MGLPHKAPVHKDRNAKIAPVGASARVIMPDRRVLNTSSSTLQNAMAR